MNLITDNQREFGAVRRIREALGQARGECRFRGRRTLSNNPFANPAN